MRFTKIPLIATLMAVALSLLIVLPTLAQVSGDRTDGRLSVGDWIDVRVADNLDDLDNTPAQDTPAPANIPTGADAWATAAGAGAFDARDTYFAGDLYVSNKMAAYNTVLITAKVSGDANLQASGPSGNTDYDTTDTADDSVANCYGSTDGTTGGSAIATITNTRSNTKVTAYLVPTNESEGTPAVTIYQGIVAVMNQEDSIEKHNGPCNADQTDPEAYAESAERTADAGRANTAGILPVNDPDTPDVDENQVAQDAYMDPANADGWTHASAAVIPARDGDSLTITVKGVAGSISVVVDGDAPDVESVSPASGVTRENVVNLQFTVSDDGAGLRYDQESGASGDVDLSPFNGDGDQRFDEPISQAGPTHDPGAATSVIDYGDGATDDIRIYYDDDNSGMTLPYVWVTGCVDSGATPGDPTDVAQCADDGSGSGEAVDNPDNPDYVGIAVYFDAAADETSSLGGNGWTQVRKGVEYSLDMRITGNEFGTYYWQVTAKDRVGNSVTTDGDEDTDGKQPYKFTVDDAGPVVPDAGASSRDGARTGVMYEPGVGEKAHRAWIALEFVNSGHPDDRDRIDAATVDPGDFTVGGHTVIAALVPSETKCADGAGKAGGDIKGLEEACLSSPGSRIYLQLSEDLAADATPTIQLLGGAFKDIAGNNNVTDSFKAVDKIAPGINITITSSTGTANRAAASDPDDDSFTVRVTSDEDLSRFPRLWFATIEGSATITDGRAGNASNLMIAERSSLITMSEVDTNTWEKKVKVSSLPGENDRILAAVITAADEASPDANPGNSAGWKGSGDTPVVGDGLDFKKLDAGGFLVEIDDELMKAVVTVRPAADPGETDPEVRETESGNPYIELNFPEVDEYGITVTDDQGTTEDMETWPDDAPTDYDHEEDDVTGTATKVDIGDGDTLRVDSHRAVTLTALAINGESRLDEVVRVDPWKYVLAVTGLEVGEYEITYAAMDDVGNEVDEDDASADFEVLERQPYEIELDPGWNLISVPGDPFNPAVSAVIGDLKADTVLGFQGGEWVTAVKGEDGRWMGTLTDIQGGYGYWVRTTVVETIETVIPPVLPTSVLPTVPIVAGWNLIGVVDPEQHDTDTADARHSVDEYLTSLGNAWRVAYGFETQQNSWSKLLPKASPDPSMVENGRGYWLWNTRPGTLVP
ncbi:MAG: hypothetical protein OXO53_07870 [Chloroflexota bacterium]|nr:hypothetical protein [Chloroflexota bacterium]